MYCNPVSVRSPAPAILLKWPDLLLLKAIYTLTDIWMRGKGGSMLRCPLTKTGDIVLPE